MSDRDLTTPPRRPKPIVWVAAALLILALIAGAASGLAVWAGPEAPGPAQPTAAATPDRSQVTP